MPEGASPEDAAKLHRDLDGLLDRYQPYPGQSADEAVAALRYEFEDRVRDFAQDQRIDAVLDEQRRQVEEAQAVEAELAEFRGNLQSRLDDWTPPAGADPEEVAELREALEGMIDRATAFPGQSADDAMANLRLQFNDQVGDFAQDLKIDALVDEQRADDDSDVETETETETDIETETETETATDGEAAAESEAEPEESAPTEPPVEPGEDVQREDDSTAAEFGEQLTREVPQHRLDAERVSAESLAPNAAVLADEFDEVMAGEAVFMESAEAAEAEVADEAVATAEQLIAARVDLGPIPDDVMGLDDEFQAEGLTNLTAPDRADPAGGRGVVMDPATAAAIASEDDVTAFDPDLDLVAPDPQLADGEFDEFDPAEVAVDESLAEPELTSIVDEFEDLGLDRAESLDAFDIDDPID